MIEVTSVVRGYPDPSEGSSGISSIAVKSHWNDPNKIVLLVEGCSVTVLERDILAAITNAKNSARF